MTNMELAFLLGQPKGIDDRKLISAAKPLLLLASGIDSSDFHSAENIRTAREIRQVAQSFKENSSQTSNKASWIDKDYKSKTPILNNNIPFIPNQNELPF